MAEGILVQCIIEIMGKPAEHIRKTMERYVEKFKKTHTIITSEIAEPTEVEEGFFSIFVDLEIRFKNIEGLFGFCLDAMPSSIQIVEPEHLSFQSTFLSDFLNDIQSKLHTTDMLVKTNTARRERLEANTKQIFFNFVKVLLEKKSQTAEELSGPMGLRPEDLKLFLDEYVKDKKVVKKKDVYTLS